MNGARDDVVPLLCAGCSLGGPEAGGELPPFRLARGETLAVLLPGAGQVDDAGRCLIGLRPPPAGRVALFGEDPARLSDERLLKLRRRLAWAPGSPEFLATVTARENVAIPLRDRMALREQETEERVASMLHRLGVEIPAPALPHQLDAPRRYLAGLARAVLTAPELLIVGEAPFPLPAPALEKVSSLLAALRAAGGPSLLLLSFRELHLRAKADNIVHMPPRRNGPARVEGQPA
ncbi:MAG: hypothetical protein HY812_17280 [Planctomycetes bacterium]|nr:hypothetical protein [Planctomycetota bacterium]